MRRNRQDRRPKEPIEERFVHLASGYFLDRETGGVVVL